MATKIFSSRADEGSLAYADSITRQRFGMSYGQYCGSVLLDAVKSGVPLPEPAKEDKALQRAKAAGVLKSLSQKRCNQDVGNMNDQQIKDLITSRYE